MSDIARFVVKVNGETYGAYLTQEHADEIVERLEKKGQKNVTVGNRAMDWAMPDPEEVKPHKANKK